jgi:signal transduction histidine kinase
MGTDDNLSRLQALLAEQAALRRVATMVAASTPAPALFGLWGAVMATSERPHAFPAETEARVSSFAELVTAALANVDAREQLAASRARIVEAADAARRRIERDLHDGAQQRLVSLALTLRRIESSLEPSSVASHEVAVARAELDAALEELRELARGIHPSVLTDRGLEAALAGVAGRSTVPVELDLDTCGKLPMSVQTTAYFVVVEALTNASKHAHPDRIDVRVAVCHGQATVEVRDDGIGGVESERGSGLTGLADRVSALGGTLEIDSPAGAGTTIRARIPVSSPGDDGRDTGADLEYSHAG